MKTEETSVAPSVNSQRWPGWPAWLIIATCVLVVLVVRWLEVQPKSPLPAVIDPAIVNLITLIAGFICVVTLLTWLVFRSGFSRQVRLGTVIGIGVLLIVAVATVRLDGFKGDMFPQFAWRWSPKPDRQLERINVEPVAQASAVDLKTTTPDDFPRFLGPDANAYLPGPVIERDWAVDGQELVGDGPRLLWKREVGAGWSAFAVVNGFAVTLEQRGPEEWITCYEVATGKPVWGHAIEARHETKLGGIGPRSTPTIHDGRVFAVGATGVLRCLDGATGELIWQDSVPEQVGTSYEEESGNYVFWGRAGSPLMVDDLVVVPGGGKPKATVSLVAYRQTDGEVVWKGGDKQIAYATPVLATIAGTRQILITNEDTVSGHDAKTGQELWTFPWPGHSNGNASASQPVVLAGDRVFISKGYGGGCAVFQIAKEGDAWSAEEVWAKPRLLKTKFTNVVLLGDFAYGLSDGILECVELDSGTSQWKRGRYGNGQVLGVGELLLVLSEDGELVLVEASPEAHREVARMQVLEGQTWNTLCLTGTKLLVRNGEEAACYDLPVAAAE